MATFFDLKLRLERWIIDKNIQITTESGDLINKAHRELQDRYNFKAMEATTAAIETTNITRLLTTLPTDWKERRANPYLIDVNGNTWPIEWAPSEEEMVKIYDDNTTTGKGEPEFLYETFTGFNVYPYPDELSDHANGNWQIVIPYWKYLDVLSDDADTDWITENRHWPVFAHALSFAFLLNQDEERAAVWTQIAENDMTRGIKHEKRKKVKRSGVLRPRTDVNAPFNSSRNFYLRRRRI